MSNFAVVGVGGHVAPRHLTAIRENGGKVIAAVDPNDSVGVLDAHDLDVPFFVDPDRFDRFLEKRRHGPSDGRLHYLAVCSPNFAHDAHCRLGLRLKADVICEKPVVINPWNLDALEDLEQETGHHIWAVLQLRYHERLRALRSDVSTSAASKHEVELTYVTARGNWYDVSWKGNPEKSGGIAVNIGVHLFDMLVWLFGKPERQEVHLREPRRMAGFLDLERARVRWFLSVNAADVPLARRAEGARTLRSLTIDGREVDFSSGFSDLHTRVYAEVLAGNGCGLREARPAIELAHAVRHQTPTSAPPARRHELLRERP